MAERADLGDHLLARRRRIRPLAQRCHQAARLQFQPFDALKEVKRPQRRRRMHAGIDQHENRDDHAMLVLFEEIQSEIDQRQEHEVGEKSIGVAQKQHEDAPGGLGKCRTSWKRRTAAEPAEISSWRARSVYANGATVGATTRPPAAKNLRAVALRTRKTSKNRLC